MNKKILFSLSFLSFFIFSNLSAQQIDPTFATNGFSTADNISHVTDMAFQSDGKIILCGSYKGPTSDYDFAFCRFNADGTLDKSFGQNGLVYHSQAVNKGGRANRIAIQSDGKIVVVGRSSLNWIVVRCNPDGTLDNTFASAGVFLTLPKSSLFEASDVIIQPDGKIVTFGDQITTRTNFASMRLMPDGTLDKTYGKKGINVPDFEYKPSSADDAELMSDGGFLVLGDFFKDLAIYKLDSKGYLDPSYGKDGIQASAVSAGNISPYKMIKQTDGKLLVLAEASKADQKGDFVFIRYNSDGSSDLSYGDQGSVYVDFNKSNEKPRNFDLCPDGKAIVSGISFQGKAYVGCLAKVDASGKIDESFGTKGQIVGFPGSNFFQPTAISVQKDGTIYAAGDYSSDNSTRVAIVRLK
ncbi:MAG: delta-60 repeat domain-containing protein [Saprospiraceae bacterium]